MLIWKVRPGPVLHVYRDGQEIATLPLTPDAALTPISDLVGAIRWR